MAVPTIKTLHFMAITSRSRWRQSSSPLELHFMAITSRSPWRQSSSPLELYTRSDDVPRPDIRPQTKTLQLDIGRQEKGKAIAFSLEMPQNLYYFDKMVLIIKGNDLWLPKTMAFYAEDTTGYVYPIVKYMNWPQRKDSTWSTDPKEGKAQIHIFPLLLDV